MQGGRKREKIKCPLESEKFRKLFAYEIANELYGRLLSPSTLAGDGGKALFEATVRHLEFRDQLDQLAARVVEKLEQRSRQEIKNIPESKPELTVEGGGGNGTDT